MALVDLRERTEREKHGVIPGSLHAPYPDLQENISPGGMLHELASATGKRIVFYCAFGERSAMAVQAAQDAGIASACHIHGGIDAWKKADGPLARLAVGRTAGTAARSLRDSAAIGFRELRSVVELAELDHLAIADREHVDPVARHLAAGLTDLPGIMAEHADTIIGGEEFSRQKNRSIPRARRRLGRISAPRRRFFQLPNSG